MNHVSHPIPELEARVRLLIVDDHTLFRRGLLALLSRESGFDVVGEAADALEGVKLAAQLKPDLVLLDLHMPGVSGLEAIRTLREALPGVRIVMLTVSEEADDLVAALRAGADGYLLKNIDSEFLIDSIRRALAGKSVMSPAMTEKLVGEMRGGAKPAAAHEEKPSLSPRETEILRLVAAGASNKEIARELGVAESTVKIHVQHILRKLNLSSRVQAAVYAAETGLTPRV